MEEDMREGHCRVILPTSPSERRKTSHMTPDMQCTENITLASENHPNVGVYQDWIGNASILSDIWIAWCNHWERREIA